MTAQIRQCQDDLARLARQEHIIGPLSELEERERARLRELLAHLYDDELADWDWWQRHDELQHAQAKLKPVHSSMLTPMGMDEEVGLGKDRGYLVEYDQDGRKIGRRRL